MLVRDGVASGLKLRFRSSFETIGVTLREDFVGVGWISFSFLKFTLGKMVRSGVMNTSAVGVEGEVGVGNVG